MDIDMDIKELEAFVYVVENCSFSRAAELLHLTQPTISSHISALERKLGVKLVVRTTKEPYHSDAGKLHYRYDKENLQVREHAAEAVRMALAEDGAAEHEQLRQRTIAAVGETEQAALRSARQLAAQQPPAVADSVGDVDERHTVAAAACGLRRRDREKDRHRRYPLAENGKNW